MCQNMPKRSDSNRFFTFRRWPWVGSRFCALAANLMNPPDDRSTTALQVPFVQPELCNGYRDQLCRIGLSKISNRVFPCVPSIFRSFQSSQFFLSQPLWSKGFKRSDACVTPRNYQNARIEGVEVQLFTEHNMAQRLLNDIMTYMTWHFYVSQFCTLNISWKLSDSLPMSQSATKYINAVASKQQHTDAIRMPYGCHTDATWPKMMLNMMQQCNCNATAVFQLQCCCVPHVPDLSVPACSYPDMRCRNTGHDTGWGRQSPMPAGWRRQSRNGAARHRETTRIEAAQSLSQSIEKGHAKVTWEELWSICQT